MYRATRPMVHAIAELEVAEREFGHIDVVKERIELRLVDVAVLPHLGIHTRESLEVLTLVGVVQGLAEIEVLQIVRTGIRTGQRAGQDDS